ncbi:MAG: polysaccharide biosynthesis tyrosine autokinase [Sphingobacteriaceae bacterium]|nr:MAG: polysaccharide biosynthesis tyrosine autokinase [Sphingobacteriaceae bacterium]
MASNLSSNDNNFNPEVQDEDVIDVKAIIGKLIGNWYLFVASALLFLALAVIYAYFAKPEWKTSSKILVEDQKNSPSQALNGGINSDLSSLFNIKSSADNEIEILKSRSLMTQVVNLMQLNIRTYIKTGFKYIEIYHNEPFKIEIKNSRDTIKDQDYFIEILNNENFKISNGSENINIEAHFGREIQLPQFKLTLNKSSLFKSNGKYKILVQSPDVAVSNFLENYAVDLSSKQATTIDLSLNYPNAKKSEDILNKLMLVYLQNNLQNKVSIADSTMRFIRDRLVIVSEELANIEKQLQNYKQQNNIADISEQSKALVSGASDYYNKLNEIEVQLVVVRDLNNYLNKAGNGQTIPSSLTTKDPAFGQAINAYNELIAQREKLKLSYTDENPVIQNITQQADIARRALLKSVSTYQNSLLVSRAELNKQNASFTGKIKQVPAKERVFLDYSRQQNLEQSLYLFLLQKREETAISKTSTISSSRIIDYAKSDFKPFKPKRSIIYIFGLIVGLILPAIYLFIKELLNIRINTKSDIQKITAVPIIGEISHNKDGKSLVVDRLSRTVISEQFRGMRTNLQYILDNQKSNVLLFTSSMSGEGKSFLSLNLGSALVLTGKKVVFIELDLRKPKLSESVGVDNSNGYTNYVISDTTTVDSILKPLIFHENCFLISSGAIPPNPAELLMSHKLEELITELKTRFDYVIIDCAPVGLVADALLIERLTDLTFYVVRQEYTYKSQLRIVNDLKISGKAKNLYLVVNDIKVEKNGSGYGGYGYGGYGYGGYGEEPEKTSWFAKYFKR